MRAIPGLFLLSSGCGGWVGETYGWSDFVELTDEPVAFSALLTSTVGRDEADRLTAGLQVGGLQEGDELRVAISGRREREIVLEGPTEGGLDIELPHGLFPCRAEVCEETWVIVLHPDFDAPRTLTLGVLLEVGHRGDALPVWTGRVGVDVEPTEVPSAR